MKLTKLIKKIKEAESNKETKIKSFHTMFPVADFTNKLPILDYDGIEYIITDISFDKFEITIETTPCYKVAIKTIR